MWKRWEAVGKTYFHENLLKPDFNLLNKSLFFDYGTDNILEIDFGNHDILLSYFWPNHFSI